MKTRHVWLRHLLALSLALLILCGCSRGIKESLYAITGSSGKAVLIQGDTATVAQLTTVYGRINVESFANEVGQVCPDEFLAELPVAIREQLRYRDRSLKERLSGKDKEELGPFFTGPAEKTLVIRGTVKHYEMGSLTDKAAGPLDEVICRVQFVDSDTGEVIGEANCTGRVKSSVRTGPKEMAEGVGKAIKKLLKTKDGD